MPSSSSGAQPPLERAAAAEAAFSSVLAEWRAAVTSMRRQRSHRFGDTQTEWHELVTKRRTRDRELVERWEPAYLGAAAEQSALVQAGRWVGGPADLMGVLGVGRRETLHSAAIAWLLGPGHRHRLGARMLTWMLERCFGETDLGNLRTVRIEREVARSTSIADIVIWAETFTLVIENKVDAPEGPDQCQRLYDDFSSEPDALFVLLSPKGREPVTATSAEAVAAWRTLSYPMLAAALRSALAETEQADLDGGRRAAYDYLATIEKEFL